MSLPLFFTDAPLESAAPGDQLEITGPAHHHAVTVRRMKAGEQLELTDGRGLRVRGVLTAASKEAAVLDVDEVEREDPQRPRLGLIQALAKGDRDLAAVETSVEVGADLIVPWQAQRSIQSRRARSPELGQLSSASSIAARARDGALIIVLHEAGTQPLVQTLRRELDTRLPDEVCVVVGPEGGITDAERQQMEDAGAVTAVLGPTVLRASSAGPIALALIQQELGRWG